MNKKGLTLVEIIISIAILGMVALLFVNIFSVSFKHIMDAGDQSKTLIEDQGDLESLISTQGPGIQNDIDMHDLFSTVYAAGGLILEGVTVDDGDFIAYLPGVTNYEIFATQVLLSDSAITFSEIGGYQNVTASILPVDATDQELIWSSNNEGVATVQNGLIRSIAEGAATITVLASGTDPTGPSIFDSLTVTITLSGPPQSTDATLSSMSAGGDLSPSFAPDTYFYNVSVPGGQVVTLLEDDFTTTDSNANVQIVTQATATDPKGLTVPPFGANTTATVRVIAEDGITVIDYILHFLKK